MYTNFSLIINLKFKDFELFIYNLNNNQNFIKISKTNHSFLIYISHNINALQLFS